MQKYRLALVRLRQGESEREIAAALGAQKLPVGVQSSIAQFRPLVERWLEQGVSGGAIHAALCREHGFAGHYSSVRRLIAAIERERPPEATVRLRSGGRGAGGLRR